MNSCLTLALATGQSVNDLTRNVLANLGWDEVRLPAPLFEGDTLYSESEVLSTRESRSRPEAGIVTVRTRGKNQDGVVVIEFRRTFLIWKRAHAPDWEKRLAQRPATDLGVEAGTLIAEARSSRDRRGG